MIRPILKLAIPALFASLFLISCSSTKSVATASRDDVKGSWTLDQVSYDGLASNDNVRITLLDEGDRKCLVGSTWYFPNNGKGNYNITSNSSGCTQGERNIIWSYQVESGQPILQYKRLPGGVQPQQIKEGYKFKIVSVSKTSLVLQSQVDFEGKPLYISYNVSRP